MQNSVHCNSVAWFQPFERSTFYVQCSTFNVLRSMFCVLGPEGTLNHGCREKPGRLLRRKQFYFSCVNIGERKCINNGGNGCCGGYHDDHPLAFVDEFKIIEERERLASGVWRLAAGRRLWWDFPLLLQYKLRFKVLGSRFYVNTKFNVLSSTFWALRSGLWVLRAGLRVRQSRTYEPYNIFSQPVCFLCVRWLWLQNIAWITKFCCKGSQ